MEIVIIRHGDPDYSIDSLTEKGRIEAALLAEKISKMDVKAFYCSPLGRAKDTAEYTLKKMNREAEILDWLHEFKGRVQLPDGRVRGSWDILPSMWANDERYYDRDEWCKTELMTTVGNVESEYEIVKKGFDDLLARHGYVRDGHIFRVEQGHHDRIVLFCHYAVGAIMTSYLMGISPMAFLQNAVALTTSVTVFASEEREKGIASFRMMCYSDTGHLYAGNHEPSFAARFCECFEDDTKH